MHEWTGLIKYEGLDFEGEISFEDLYQDFKKRYDAEKAEEWENARKNGLELHSQRNVFVAPNDAQDNGGECMIGKDQMEIKNK